MIAVLRNVTAIRELLEEKTGPDQAQGASLARDYARNCGEANARLAQCAKYLAKGLKGEALQQAHTQPDLMELCAMLDFPEAWRWRALAGREEWPVPEALDIRTVDALRQADLENESREPLVEKYRLAAMRRDDGECASILRRLAELEPTNPIWTEDLRRFERKRMASIEARCREALAMDDAETLRYLLDELVGKKWTVDMRSSLRKEILDRLMAIRRRDAAKGAVAVEAQLTAARADNDVEKTQAALAAWKKTIAGDVYEPSTEQKEKVEEARAWLATKEKARARGEAFQSKLGDLERALERAHPDFDVAPLWKSLRAYNLPLPKELPRKVRSAMDALQRRRAARRRRAWLIALASGVAVVALGGLLSWMGGLRRSSNEWARELEAAFESTDLPAFQATKEALTASTARWFGSRVLESKAVQAWVAREGDLDAAYQVRLAKRELAWTSLEELRSNGFAPGREEIDPLVQRARGLSIGKEDDERVAAFTNDWRAAKVAQVEALLQEIEARVPPAGQELTGSLDEARTRLEEAGELLAKARVVDFLGVDHSDQIFILDERRGRLLKDVEERQETLVSLVESTTVRPYITAAEKYIAAYGDDAISQALRPVLARTKPYNDLVAMPPASTYTKPSARVHFEKLFDDVLYPRISAENRLWNGPVEALVRTHRALSVTWPGVRDAIKALADDHMLMSVWQYKEADSGDVGFAELPFSDAGGLAAYQKDELEARVYVPSLYKRSVDFKDVSLPRSEMRDLRVMAHCEFLKRTIAEVGYLDESEADVFLLRKMRDLYENPEIINPLLKLKLILFLANQFMSLDILAPETDRLRELVSAMKRIDERSSVSWMCILAREIESAGEEAQTLLKGYFDDAAQDRSYQFRRAIQASCVSRGARFVGAAGSDGSLPTTPHAAGAPELWVLRGDPDGGFAPEVVAERTADGALEKSGEILPMEPLFAPGGADTSRALLQQCLESASLADLGSIPLDWPPAWPTNRRE